MITTKKPNKPYTRLWIYGLNIDKDSIHENIRLIKEAGIGGIEIQVLYAVATEGNMDFFSPEFFENLNYLIQYAHENGLEVDLTLGSGWPFGASFITKDMSPDILIPYQQDIIGPTTYDYDFTCVISGKIVSAILCKIEDGLIVPNTLQDVSAYVHKTYIGVWPWGEEVKNLPVGEGVYRLFLFVSNEYRQRVGKAAPNMDGYAMDHCRKDVTDLYLSQLGDTLLDHLDSSKIRGVFCDSIELTGSNWTKYLLQEFQTRRGYDLTPWMPALWQDIQGISPYIRNDYYRTYGTLTVENFFERIKQWAEKRNISFRLQAHGTWADILEAYGASHIPEGETFGFGDVLDVNINHRRLAVSAAMQKQLSLVSNETYTWLRKPRFLVTLEMMKKATDACFVDGINHIFNHGYSFYKGEPFENVFYASTVISPHNTWWSYYPLLSRYIANTCAYLQNSTIKTRVAMLTPTTHIWATNPMAELHMSLKIEKHITKPLANQLATAGYWFGFVNDTQIVDSRAQLYLGDNPIQCLIIPDMQYIHLETLEKIETLADGIKIIFFGAVPTKCDTFVNYEAKNKAIETIIGRLQGHPNVFFVSRENLVHQVQTLLSPDLCIQNNQDIGYIIRHNPETQKDFIFVTNISDNGKQISITKPFNGGFQIYDPMKDEEYLSFDYDGTTLHLWMDANQSYIIEETESLPNATGLQKPLFAAEIVLDHWSLTIQEKRQQLDSLTCWEQLEGYEYYSGKGLYETTFVLEDAPAQARLSLEHVHEVCEVLVNHQKCGVIWKQPYTLDITPFVQKGINHIQLLVTNLLFNASLNFQAPLPQEKLSTHKPYLNCLIEQQRRDKVDTFREKEEGLGLQKSGLDGIAKVLMVSGTNMQQHV